MNFQDASNLRIPEGYVRTIHDKNNRLLWGSVGYDVTFDGNAEQTTYSGKNLISNDGWGNIIYNNGTSAPSTTRATTGFNPIVGGTYTLTLNGSSNYACIRNIVFFDENQDYLGARQDIGLPAFSGTVRSISFTLPDTAKYVRFTFGRYNADTSTADIAGIQADKPMCEHGSTAQPYEPYVGGTASPNPDYPQAVNTVTGEQVVKVVGKNLANLPENTTLPMAINPVTVFDNGQEITVSSLVMTFIMQDAIYTNAGGALIDFQKADGSHQYRTTTQMRDADNAQPPLNTAFSGTYYLRQTANLTFRKVNVYLGTSYANWSQGTVSVQLELNTTNPTTYEPYQGQEFPIDLASKNVFNPDILPATWTNTSAVYVPLNLKPNTTYTMSSNIPRASGNALIFFLESGQAIGTNTNGVWEGQTRTLTTDASGNNLRIVYRSFQGETRTRDDYQFQLEEGSSASEYEAYYSLELAKIGTYQDRIYKNEGKWYIEKQVGKVTYDGSENWRLYLNKTKTFMASLGYGIRALDGISDHFKKGFAQSFDVNPCFYPFNTASLIFSMPSVADLAGWKSWLASNPTTVYYALATPTTTEITDGALIRQLEAVYDWVRRHGYNASVTGDLPIIINRSTLS